MPEWFRTGWPWFIPFGLLIAYELVALLLRKPTLSQLATRAQRAHPWVAYASLSGIAILFPHFWLVGEPAWMIGIAALVIIWAVYWAVHGSKDAL